MVLTNKSSYEDVLTEIKKHPLVFPNLVGYKTHQNKTMRIKKGLEAKEDVSYATITQASNYLR